MSLKEYNIRLDQAEEKISELKDRILDIIPSEKKKGKKVKKSLGTCVIP